jgi:hypothetical protein
MYSRAAAAAAGQDTIIRAQIKAATPLARVATNTAAPIWWGTLRPKTENTLVANDGTAP